MNPYLPENNIYTETQPEIQNGEGSESQEGEGDDYAALFWWIVGLVLGGG